MYECLFANSGVNGSGHVSCERYKMSTKSCAKREGMDNAIRPIAISYSFVC